MSRQGGDEGSRGGEGDPTKRVDWDALSMRRRIGPEAAWPTCTAAQLPVPPKDSSLRLARECESEHRSRATARAEQRTPEALFRGSGAAALAAARNRSTAKMRGGSACHLRITVSAPALRNLY